MRYAIISDVHANLSALERVLADAAAEGADMVVSLGDTVGYGPQPAETLRLVREKCAVVLAGNHDDAVSGRMDAGDFIDLAHDAALRHREELSEEDLKYLGALEYVWEGDGFVAAHGDFLDPPAFNYIDDVESAAANFAASRHQLMFVGHTHVPSLALTGASGAVYVAPAQDFALEEGKRYIVNPGSVGYPREKDGKCLSSYAIYDADSRSVFFRYIPFTVDSMLQRGRPKRRRGLFLALASALALAVAAAGYFAFSPSPRDAATVVASEELAVAAGGKVAANLVLGRDSPGVELRLEFLDAAGAVISVESLTVRRSSRRGFKAAPGAVRAKFTLLKCREADSPVVESFAPAAVGPDSGD